MTGHLGVALEFQGVGEGFEAETTIEEVNRMRLFMVEKRAGMSVGASTLIACITLVRCILILSGAWCAVFKTAMSLQSRLSPKPFATRVAAIIGDSSGMNLLVVVEDTRKAKSFATSGTDILFLLCVNPSVVTERHRI